jgi:hypothetical protein
MKRLSRKVYNRLVAESCYESNRNVGKPERRPAQEILKAKLRNRISK